MSRLGATGLGVLVVVACSASSGGTSKPSQGEVNGDGGSASESPTTGGGTVVATGGIAITIPDSGTHTGNGTPEECNGIDDDENGVIDDLDAAGDGICDCLRIATLGVPGVHGSGDVFASWLGERSTNGSTDIGSGTLDADTLREFQVIVAQDLSVLDDYTDDEVAALAEWVDNGGGFMTLIGYSGPDEVQNVNRLLAPFGMNYGEQQIMHKVDDATRVVEGFIPHPVTKNVGALGTDNGYETQGEGTVLLNVDSYDLLLASTHGEGRILMWADEWISYDSEWTSRPELHVEQFWLNAIMWLTPVAECQVPIPVIE